MSRLEDLSLPRVVLLADADGLDESGAVDGFVTTLRALGRQVAVRSLAEGEGQVARRALLALEGGDDLLVLTAAGLLTALDPRGGTLADAGTALRYKGASAGVVLGLTPGSTGRRHTLALHAEVLRGREVPLLGALEVSAGPQAPSWSSPDAWDTMAP